MSKKTVTIVYNTAIYVYKFRMNLIKMLQEEGYNVVVIAPYDSYVDQLKSYGVEYYEIRMTQYGMNPFKSLGVIYQLWKAFRKFRPTVSLHYTIKPNLFGNIAAYFSHTPVINNIAGAGKAFSSKNKLFTIFIESLFSLGLKSSKKVFFQNNDDMNHFMNKKLIDKKKAERIPGSGVDLARFIVLSDDKKDQDIVFLFVGRLLRQKGIVEYLKAATEIKKMYNHVQFLIVGEHEESDDYIDKKDLDSYCDNTTIKYLGGVSPDKMPMILKDSDCVVLPSYYREGVPRSLLEAAAMAKPIITTNNVGCKEVVEEGINGFKCNIKDFTCIVKAMRKFLEMLNEERIQMGKNGRLKMEKEFDEKFVLDSYMKAINQISSNKLKEK